MKIFEFNKGQSGTLIDSVSKTAGTLTAGAGGFKKTEKGLAMEFDGSATKIIYPNDVTMVDGDSIFFDIKCSDFSNYPTFFGKDGLVNNYIRFESNGTLRVFVPSNNIIFTKVFKENIRYFIEVKFNGSLIDLYVNGLYVESKTWSSTYTLKFNTISTGYSSRWFKGYIGQVLIESGVNTTRRNELYKEFLQASPTEKDIRGFEYPKPTDLSSEVDSVLTEIIALEADREFTSITGNWVLNSPTNINTTESILNINSPDGSSRGAVYGSLVSGQKYRLTYNVSANRAGKLQIYTGGSILQIDETVGIHTVEFTANGNIFNINRYGSSADIDINWISLKEVTGLVAAYSFSPETVSNGTLLDVSGNGNNGTINGALLTKDGMKFDGVKDKIVIDEISLNKATLCFKLGDVLGTTINHHNIIGANVGAFEFISVTNGILTWLIGGSWKQLSINNKSNVCVIYDNGTYKLYVNGLLKIEGTEVNQSVQIKGIGWWEQNNERFFKGEIQDLKIYNYAFTPQQAQDYSNSFMHPTLILNFEDEAVGNTI